MAARMGASPALESSPPLLGSARPLIVPLRGGLRDALVRERALVFLFLLPVALAVEERRRVALLALLAGGDRGHLLHRAVEGLARRPAAEEEAQHREPRGRARALVQPAAPEEADHHAEHDLE